MKVEEDYEKFVKWFLIFTLIYRVYLGPQEAQDTSSPKVENEGLPKIN